MRPALGEPDQICGECWQTYQDCARLVCNGCHQTVCRVVPKKLDNGFEILPRSTLHIDKCAICEPEIKESTIIEIAEWERLGMATRKIIVPARKLFVPTGIKVRPAKRR